MKERIQKTKNEEGATLVEILAAITILSIVVTAFLAFFIQAANTNNRTDQVNEATFLAQEEMENIMKYNQSDNLLLENYEWNGEARTTEEGYILTTAIEKKDINEDGPMLYNVLVTVKEGEDKLAQMETWLPLKDSDEG